MLKANVPSNATVTVLPDTRTKFERLNRMSLYYLLRENGIKDVSDAMPKTRLVQIAELNEDKLITMREDGAFSYNNVEAYKDANQTIVIKRPKDHNVPNPKSGAVGTEGHPEWEPQPTHVNTDELPALVADGKARLTTSSDLTGGMNKITTQEYVESDTTGNPVPEQVKVEHKVDVKAQSDKDAAKAKSDSETNKNQGK